MKIMHLIQSINTQLAGELLSVAELKDFVDKAIDDVNTRLNTKFPTLTDVMFTYDEEGNLKQGTDYTAIPDKYLRTVVIPGAVFKYFITDEEGAAVAPKYEEEFLKGLFYMERDYLEQVPIEYQETTVQGWVTAPGFQPNRVRREGEFTIDGSVFQL